MKDYQMASDGYYLMKDFEPNPYNQAKKGGEYGVNGEWYKGGQFLPSSPETVKGAQKVVIHKGKKSQIAPYVWEPAPADNMLSIYDRIGGMCTDNRRECEYVKGQGLLGFKLTGFMVYQGHEGLWTKPDKNGKLVTYRQWVESLIEKFNAGQRWFQMEDDPFYYRNNFVQSK